MSLELYQLDNSGPVLAFLGARGDQGVLAYVNGKWHYHPWGSSTWDSWHQAAYRAHRADARTAEDLQRMQIPAPDPSQYQIRSVSWESNFRTWLNFYEFTIAQLDWLKKVPRLYLILVEDLYETNFGDGKFIYLHQAFWNEAEAREAFESLTSTDKVNYTYKVIGLTVNDQRQRVIGEFDLKPFEHLNLDEILKKVFAPRS